MALDKEPHAFDILKKVVKEAACFDNWSFDLIHTGLVYRLVITIDGRDNYDQKRRFIVRHYHPVPHTTYNEKSWRRWVLEQCLRTMNHEIGEALRFGPDGDCVRPFAPMHGPGEDPYTVHEWRPETDALTTQDGSLRPGPV